MQQSHEALKGLFSKSEHVTDTCVPSPTKDGEKHLIRVLLDSFSSNKLGPPNHKVPADLARAPDPSGALAPLLPWLSGLFPRELFYQEELGQVNQQRLSVLT